MKPRDRGVPPGHVVWILGLPQINHNRARKRDGPQARFLELSAPKLPPKWPQNWAESEPLVRNWESSILLLFTTLLAHWAAHKSTQIPSKKDSKMTSFPWSKKIAPEAPKLSKRNRNGSQNDINFNPWPLRNPPGAQGRLWGSKMEPKGPKMKSTSYQNRAQIVTKWSQNCIKDSFMAQTG